MKDKKNSRNSYIHCSLQLSNASQLYSPPQNCFFLACKLKTQSEIRQALIMGPHILRQRQYFLSIPFHGVSMTLAQSSNTLEHISKFFHAVIRTTTSFLKPKKPTWTKWRVYIHIGQVEPKQQEKKTDQIFMTSINA